MLHCYIIDNVDSDIHQVEIMDIYNNPVICVNFPDNRKNIKVNSTVLRFFVQNKTEDALLKIKSSPSLFLF